MAGTEGVNIPLGSNVCLSCGHTVAEHYSETDNTQLLGLWGPVPAYQPPVMYWWCPYDE